MSVLAIITNKPITICISMDNIEHERVSVFSLKLYTQ